MRASCSSDPGGAIILVLVFGFVAVPFAVLDRLDRAGTRALASLADVALIFIVNMLTGWPGARIATPCS